jgi:transcriptional regulator with XRE-family HTH domain
MVRLGPALKKARLAKGMTLEVLSSKCGYSKALISRIENDSVSPSIESLAKISETLDVKIYDIFSAVEDDEPVILRKRDRQRFVLPKEGYEMELLSSGSSTKTMQPLLVSIDKGVSSRDGIVSHGGDKFVFVLDGTARVAVGEQQYVLTAGDSIYFKSTLPHEITSIGNKQSVSIVVMCPPCL